MELELRLTLPRACRAYAATLTILCLSAACVHSASAAGSSAFDISATFTSGGVTTVINPVNRLTSGSSSTYQKSANFGAYNKTLHITTGTAPVPTLTVSATNLRSHIAGGFGVDTISAEGDATVSGVDISLQLDPPPPGGPFPQPFLHITAARLQETANYNLVVPTFTTVGSNADVKGLKVSGSLVGGKTLAFSGAPAANKVLFQSPTVTITLNHKLVAALISCFPKCVVTPVSVSTSALEITLTNANLDGHIVSGQIDIGVGDAGSEAPL
jgi:hypothetical protein